jgi:hypothetical protein
VHRYVGTRTGNGLTYSGEMFDGRNGEGNVLTGYCQRLGAKRRSEDKKGSCNASAPQLQRFFNASDTKNLCPLLRQSPGYRDGAVPVCISLYDSEHGGRWGD